MNLGRVNSALPFLLIIHPVVWNPPAPAGEGSTRNL
jgi:hypothetical protein